MIAKAAELRAAGAPGARIVDVVEVRFADSLGSVIEKAVVLRAAGAPGARIVDVVEVRIEYAAEARLADVPGVRIEDAGEARNAVLYEEYPGPVVGQYVNVEAEMQPLSAVEEAEASIRLPHPEEAGWETDIAERSLPA